MVGSIRSLPSATAKGERHPAACNACPVLFVTMTFAEMEEPDRNVLDGRTTPALNGACGGALRGLVA